MSARMRMSASARMSVKVGMSASVKMSACTALPGLLAALSGEVKGDRAAGGESVGDGGPQPWLGIPKATC